MVILTHTAPSVSPHTTSSCKLPDRIVNPTAILKTYVGIVHVSNKDHSQRVRLWCLGILLPGKELQILKSSHRESHIVTGLTFCLHILQSKYCKEKYPTGYIILGLSKFKNYSFLLVSANCSILGFFRQIRGLKS